MIPPRGNLGDVPLEKTVQHIGIKAQEKVNQGLESMLKSGYAGLSYVTLPLITIKFTIVTRNPNHSKSL